MTDPNPIAARKRGRPPLDRADWNSRTYSQLARLAGVRVADIAQALDVSNHSVYCWQAPNVEKRPTPAQADAIATLLSDKLGTQITATQLGQPIADISFSFDA